MIRRRKLGFIDAHTSYRRCRRADWCGRLAGETDGMQSGGREQQTAAQNDEEHTAKDVQLPQQPQSKA